MTDMSRTLANAMESDVARLRKGLLLSEYLFRSSSVLPECKVWPSARSEDPSSKSVKSQKQNFCFIYTGTQVHAIRTTSRSVRNYFVTQKYFSNRSSTSDLSTSMSKGSLFLKTVERKKATSFFSASTTRAKTLV